MTVVIAGNSDDKEIDSEGRARRRCRCSATVVVTDQPGDLISSKLEREFAGHSGGIIGSVRKHAKASFLSLGVTRERQAT